MAERRPPIVARSQPQEPKAARPSARGQVPRADVDRGKRPRTDEPRRRVSGQVETRPRREIEKPRNDRPVSPREVHSPAAQAWTRVGPKSAQIDTVTHRMRERLAERKRTERRRAFARFGRWAAVAVVVAGALWAFFMSPLFALDPAKIELSGLSNEIDATTVTGVLDSYDGQSLALLNVPHVSDQLRNVKGVLDAKVERVWPAGLRVTLVPRHPVAVIASATGFALLDADAIQVGLVDKAPADLPLVTVPVGDVRVLAAVLDVIRNLPADLLGRVSGIAAQTEDTVSFDLRDGPHIEWGSAEDSALKAQVLQVMLASSSAPRAGVIDVSAPTLPITRAAK